MQERLGSTPRNLTGTDTGALARRQDRPLSGTREMVTCLPWT
jgi:hypothetical protein